MNGSFLECNFPIYDDVCENILNTFDNNFRLMFIKSYELLNNLCEKNVVMHCLAVADYVHELGLRIKNNNRGNYNNGINNCSANRNNGHDINLELAVLGAVLHDIGRSKTHGIAHGIEGAKILRKYNFDEKLALIAERHIGAGIPKNEAVELGLPPKDYMPISLEEKLVAHCDNLISGTERVDVDFVVNKFKKRVGNDNHPSIVRILELNDEINYLLK